MRQEQLYAPALLDILLLYLGLGPCLYIKTQYLKWSILLSNIASSINAQRHSIKSTLRNSHVPLELEL
jgi:hypothetical protein